ncbi:RidA family protein [Xanthobacter sp. TB0139]|uniref:RidA family protein n=1 Tax=Xanthobacter sp. TB0139 TaxID=3459178 RepID=UPI0040390B51
MSSSIENRLAELGVTLPTPVPPVANYLPVIRSGNLLFISGQLPLDASGTLVASGHLGANVDVATGQTAARMCAINILAQIRAEIGDLDKVVRIVKLGAFVSSTPDFTDQPKVVNGASDFMVEALGDKGRHSRSAVGVPALPLNAAVEIDAIVEVA